MSTNLSREHQLPAGQTTQVSVSERNDTCLWDDVLERPPYIGHLDRRTLRDLDSEVRSALHKTGAIQYD